MERLREDAARYYELKAEQEKVNQELHDVQVDIKKGIIESGLHQILTVNWRALSRMLNGERRAKHHKE